MTTPTRRKFLTVNDWHNFVNEQSKLAPDQAANVYDLRKACYQDIEQLRGRPLLVYVVQYPPPHPKAPISIDVADVDGFTDLISATDGAEEVDVLLHSPGGSPEATERIVGLLRSAFKKVSFLVPHSAYSAATMLSLSGDEIILHPSATLGPIDPQINGTPARSIRRGFERIRDLLKREGPQALPAYVPLIEKYSIELLEMCDDAQTLSQELATEWLSKYMFHDDPDKADVVKGAVEYFSDFDRHRTHGRPLIFEKIKGFGLQVTIAEPPLRELLREAYILFSGFFAVSPFVKMYENSKGLSWGHQFQVQLIAQPDPKKPTVALD